MKKHKPLMEEEYPIYEECMKEKARDGILDEDCEIKTRRMLRGM